MAHKLGIRSHLDAYVPSMGLGSTRSRRSRRPPPTRRSRRAASTRSRWRSARSCYANGNEDRDTGWGRPKRKRVIADWVAAEVTKILEDNVLGGTGVGAYFGRPAAGKTGTTDNHADAWFSGYVPQLETTVWVGYPQGEIPMENVHGISVAGGTFPATIWKLFMERSAIGNAPFPREFPAPVVWRPIWQTSSLAADHAPTLRNDGRGPPTRRRRRPLRAPPPPTTGPPRPPIRPRRLAAARAAAAPPPAARAAAPPPPRRRCEPALRVAALVAIPVYLAACAVPDGGLFRAARYRDVHIYQGYAERLLPRRSPVPGRLRRVPARRVRGLPAADRVRRGSLHRRLQDADGALRRRDDRARRPGPGRARGLPPAPLRRGRTARALAARPRADLAQHLRRLAGAPDRARAGCCSCAARAARRSRCSGSPSRRRSTRSCSCRWRRSGSSGGREAGRRSPARARRRSPPPLLSSRRSRSLAPHGLCESFRAQAARGAADREPRRRSFLLAARPARPLRRARSCAATGVASHDLAGGAARRGRAVLLALEVLAVARCGCSTPAAARPARGSRSPSPPRSPASSPSRKSSRRSTSSGSFRSCSCWRCPHGSSPLERSCWRRCGSSTTATLFALEWPVWLVLVRDLLLLALYAVLGCRGSPGGRRGSRRRSKTSRHSGLRRSQESWTAVGKGASRSA